MSYLAAFKAHVQDFLHVPHHLRTLMLDGERTRRFLSGYISERFGELRPPPMAWLFVFGERPPMITRPVQDDPVPSEGERRWRPYSLARAGKVHGPTHITLQLDTPIKNATAVVLCDPERVEVLLLKLGHQIIADGDSPIGFFPEGRPGLYLTATVGLRK